MSDISKPRTLGAHGAVRQPCLKKLGGKEESTRAAQGSHRGLVVFISLTQVHTAVGGRKNTSLRNHARKPDRLKLRVSPSTPEQIHRHPTCHGWTWATGGHAHGQGDQGQGSYISGDDSMFSFVPSIFQNSHGDFRSQEAHLLRSSAGGLLLQVEHPGGLRPLSSS